MQCRISPPDRNFLITCLAVLQTCTWRQTCCAPFPLEFCCKLSSRCNKILESSQWADLRLTALHFEPLSEKSGSSSFLLRIFWPLKDRLELAKKFLSENRFCLVVLFSKDSKNSKKTKTKIPDELYFCCGLFSWN